MSTHRLYYSEESHSVYKNNILPSLGTHDAGITRLIVPHTSHMAYNFIHIDLDNQRLSARCAKGHVHCRSDKSG